LKVRGLISTKTGVALLRQIEEAVAKKLKGVVITSSPSPIPKALMAKTRASVPEAQPMAFFIPR